MEQQSYSHGLLYSVAPEIFSNLHLHDDADVDGFNWEEHEAECAGDSFTHVVFSFLKITAAKWGLGRF